MPGTASSDLLTAWNVVLLVIGTNLILGALLWFLSQHYARVLRGALEHNRELVRRLWAVEVAAKPETASIVVGVEHQAARTANGTGGLFLPEIPELHESDEGLANRMGN